MLLRLRQLTSHVLMLQLVMRDLLEREDIERIRQITKDQSADTSTESGKTILAIRRQLDQHAELARRKRVAIEKAKAAAKAAGRDYKDDADSEDDEVEADGETEITASEAGEIPAQSGSRFTGHGNDFGKVYDFKPFLRSLEKGESWEKVKKKSKCAYCYKQPRLPWITSCGHLICEAPCLEDASLEAAERGSAALSCKTCGVTPTYIHKCDSDEGDDPETVAQGTRAQAQKKKKKKKAQQQANPEQEAIESDWLGANNVLPSAKTIAIKAQILNWIKKNPQVKIIVYTQFLAM